MKVKTIQNIRVAKSLMKNGKYVVPDGVMISSNLIEPYKFMMKHYGYKNRPIFMCPVGYCANFGGAKVDKESVLISLDIPDRYCKIQDYYGWSDFIYFREMPWEYSAFNGCKDVNSFGEYVLDLYKDGFIGNKGTVYQVTTQFLLKKWVTGIGRVTDDFVNNYYDTGGVNILI